MEAESSNASSSLGKGGEIVNVPAPISSSYVLNDSIDIIVDRKVLSSSKCTIYESEGAVLFGVKSIPNIFRTKRVLLDVSGKALACMKDEFASLYSKWSVYRGEEDSDVNLLFTMKKSSAFQFSPSLEVHLSGKGTNEGPDFKVKGNFSERKFKIFYGDKVVAEGGREVNAAPFFLGRGRYAVTIYPGVDHAFITSIVVILDEMHKAKQAASSAG